MIVLIADDSYIIRDGIRALLDQKKDITEVYEAVNGQVAVDFLRETHCDIVIMDISMPILNGLEAAKIISKDFPKTKILMVSMHLDKPDVELLISYKIQGYILKEQVHSDLINAVDLIVKKNESFFCKEVQLILQK